MVRHELKILPEFFRDLISERKTFEIRKNDRDYHIGDVLRLKEWDPINQRFTGKMCDRMVTYILHGGQYGIEEGYCIMSFE